jgi:hypothetical protein
MTAAIVETVERADIDDMNERAGERGVGGGGNRNEVDDFGVMASWASRFLVGRAGG